LYQPNPKNDRLDPQYERFNWYAPSIKEMSMILYYRIMSVQNSDNAANVTGDINTGITHADAIFAKAKSKMNIFPSEWEAIANYLRGTDVELSTSINAVTTKTSDTWSGLNYLYFSGSD
jgi:hypothetical protein